MKHLKYTLVISLAILAACGNAEKDSEKKIAEDVTALHDVVMPKMEEIMKTQRELKEAATKDSTLRSSVDSLNAQLNAADDAMMEWMQAYNPNYYSEGHSHDEIVKYYEAERKKIEDVQAQMEKSISSAKQFLKK
ncbi:MAG: hypothetical protein U0Y10_21865 [Spirosomataceae bacterium]